MTFKRVRIALLLLTFILVAHYTYQQTESARDWDVPLQINIYPIAGDNSPEVQQYIATLQAKDFHGLDRFFERQAKKYNINTMPVLSTELHAPIKSKPAVRPENASILQNMIWSLRVRGWAFWHTPSNNSPYSQISLYAVYHKPEANKILPHSSGLMKGLLGIAHLFASKQQQTHNNIVLGHELLHTLGATDKYDSTLQPIYPAGYADITKAPLYPQERCEIMAGRIAKTKFESYMPNRLGQCLIGHATAREINWL